MNDEPSTEPQRHPIMIRPMARRPVRAPAPESQGPRLEGRAKHFAQMEAIKPKPRPLSRAARKLAKRLAPAVGAVFTAGRRRRKG